MNITEIADEIYRDLGSSDLSVPSIAFWLVGHIGDLNNLLSKSYSISNTDGITIEPEIGINEKAIFKKLYTINFYDKKIKENLGAAANDVIEITADGGTVRMINKNEISKSYISLRKEERQELTRMMNFYRSNQGEPKQVVGDDTSSQDSVSSFFIDPIRT